eukprot:6157883-Heterocapsa_arctica.AAC.1
MAAVVAVVAALKADARDAPRLQQVALPAEVADEELELLLRSGQIALERTEQLKPHCLRHSES